MLTKNHAILVAEVQAHIAADALVQGQYWKPADNAVGGKGCFIACLTHSDDAAALADRFGLPEPLVRICENIFDALPLGEEKAFFAAIPAAVGRDGKDLTRVHWQFLAAELRALPEVSAEIQAVIDPVIAGMDLLADGKDWPDAADAARAADAADVARAAYAADAARAAARAALAAARAAYAAGCAAYAAGCAADAALAAAYAADVARAAADAVRLRQRDTILRLIAEAG